MRPLHAGVALSLLPLATALLLGFGHALEPDHVAAVTTFVARRSRPAEAFRFGLRWGIGHAGAILLAGGTLILLDLRLPAGIARGLEFGVGTLLLVLGAWLLWSLLHERAHARIEGSRLSGVHTHGHGRGSGWVGVAHGLAGTGSLVALLQVTIVPGSALAFGYLLLFGIGTVAGMATYALLAGTFLHRASARFPSFATSLRGATALGSVGLGVFWMYSAVVGTAA
ncbi:MAG: hypothetical protein M3483_01780 [Gemmatimonadota bacterium]|nr:hypothetical protein [Gemmatimonadota bacterium]